MQLLPYHTFTLKTHEPLPDVIDKLNAHIEAPKTFRWTFSRNHAPYAGRISSDGFEVRRIIHYRNSFLPTIRGRFESGSQGTVIRITMRLHPLVIGFLVFWYFTWYSATIPLFFFGIFSGDVVIVEGLLFLGLPIFVLLTFWCAFWYEANRSRRELTQIVRGEPLDPPNSSHRIRRSWLIRGVLFVMVSANILWHLDEFFPSLKRDTQPVVLKSCSDNSTESPYCNFSVFRTFTGHATALAIVISADGKTLISGGKDKAIKVWDLPTGVLKKTLQSDSGVIQALAIAPNGKVVVSGSGDRMVRIWNMTTNQPAQTLAGHTETIHGVEISSDGTTIISRSHTEIKVWDLATGQLKLTLPNSPSTEIKIGPVSIEDNSPRFHPHVISSNGKTALVQLGVGGKLVAWNLLTNQQIILQKKWSDGFGYMHSAHISGDGKTAVTIYYRQPVTDLRVWDLTTGMLKAEGRVSSTRNSFWYDTFVLSRDRIIGSTDEGIKVWNLQTAELEATLEHEKMSDLVVSSDGKLLAGITESSENQESKIKVWRRP